MADTTQNGVTANLPVAAAERQRLREAARLYVQACRLVPPLGMDELRQHAATLMAREGLPAELADFMMVLVSNAVWRDTVAAIPFERRMLLLPQCLRNRAVCRAEMDELGVLCMECGACPIGGLQAEAERLGYVVLVAEGATVVAKLLEGGKIDAVIGVSCLSALERSFPHMASGAVPGIAIPLVRDGCTGTTVDEEWIREAIALRVAADWCGWQDPDALRETVREWFTPSALDALMGPAASATERIARGWLLKGGKRWRPLLTACAYQALLGRVGALPAGVAQLGLAVECFHKASLVHDDIEDSDNERYGEATLHRAHGVPVAINVGDFLLGEGYRLIAACGLPAEAVGRLFTVAAEGHRLLSLGQGAELVWVRQPGMATVGEVLEIFRQKTAPAFDVALRLGAIAGGADPAMCEILRAFSEALGVGYQIRDDLDDLQDLDATGEAVVTRPTLPLALACEQADAAELASLWGHATAPDARHARLREWVAQEWIAEKTRQLLEHYKRQAVRCLSQLQHAALKSLLQRTVSRILDGGRQE